MSRVLAVRVAGAAAVTLTFVPLAFAVWAIGLGQYLDDYCFTTVGQDVEVGGPGPDLQWPIHVRCDYDDGTTILNVDVAPALWSIGIIITVVALVVATWALLLVKRPTP